MTPRRWRERVMRLWGRRNRYQFGQPQSGLVGNSGCTDTGIQHCVWLVKDKRVSLDKVRRMSGAPAGEPMTVEQAIRALSRFGLPYEVRRGLRASDVVRIAANQGPVMVCERYWAHPEWRDYRYLGERGNGWDRNDNGGRVHVGFARPLDRAGQTQLEGFREGHNIVVGFHIWDDGVHYAGLRDHNHNSISRAERPKYDLVTMMQLNRMLRSWPGSSLVLVPSRRLIGGPAR